jgi:hypothetical protein
VDRAWGLLVKRIICALWALLSAVVPARSTVPEPPVPTIVRLGPQQPVFTWTAMRCETWDIPDTSARAWRDAKGMVHLLASHTSNRAMVGADLDHVRPDCRAVYQGGNQDAPQLYDDRSWIASPYAVDGSTVYALVHNEFHGHLRPALCPSGVYLRCWSNSLTLVRSEDGGFSFAHAVPPRHFVAAPPYRYAGDSSHRTGYFNPSNIVRRDGFYYAFFWAEAAGAQRRGACLMRTARLDDPRAWRGWNGADFTIRFADAYADTVTDAAAHVCSPVAEGRLTSPISSLTLDRASGAYVALMATERPAQPGGAAVTGIFAAGSSDLIHWSEPTLVWQSGLLFKYQCAENVVFYPALLDPTSPSRNFEDTGARSYIYLIDIHLDSCRIGADRDLVRVPVEIRLSDAAAGAAHLRSAS